MSALVILLLTAAAVAVEISAKSIPPINFQFRVNSNQQDAYNSYRLHQDDTFKQEEISVCNRVASVAANDLTASEWKETTVVRSCHVKQMGDAAYVTVVSLSLADPTGLIKSCVGVVVASRGVTKDFPAIQSLVISRGNCSRPSDFPFLLTQYKADPLVNKYRLCEYLTDRMQDVVTVQSHVKPSYVRVHHTRCSVEDDGRRIVLDLVLNDGSVCTDVLVFPVPDEAGVIFNVTMRTCVHVV